MTSVFPQVRLDNERLTATIPLSKGIYSKFSILRVCYWFSGDLSFQLAETEDEFLLIVKPLLTRPTLEQPTVRVVEEWIPQILNRLIDEELRVEVQRETASVRELVIAKAFAEAGVLEDSPPGTFEDNNDVGTEQTTLIQITHSSAKSVE
jgi:His-Xaa-Ser system protein HxsD